MFLKQLAFLLFIGMVFRFASLAQTPALEARTQEVQDVRVGNGNQEALAKLLLNCSHGEVDITNYENAYYELKSFVDNRQLELVEAYYILEQGAYGPKGGQLKTGRFALLPQRNRYFASQATASALLGFELTNPNNGFAYTPFNVGKRPQKHFRFWLADTVLVATQDTLIEIRFAPQKNDGKSFNGTAWVNPTTKFVSQLDLQCKHCQQHPFLPIFHADSIKDFDLQLRCSFRNSPIGPVLGQIQTNYAIHYSSRTRQTDTIDFILHTEAKLQTYNRQSIFTPPSFYFEPGVNDYRQIMAYPYAADFWQTNPEPWPVRAVQQNNQLFYERAILSNRLIETGQIAVNRIFEHPFIQWSENRVLIREALPQGVVAKPSIGDVSSLYKLKVQMFADLIDTSDSLALLSACVMDPYQTFYHLPIDNNVNCFINMYFDLCEISRRNLEAKCRAEKLIAASFQGHYNKTQTELEQQLNQFLTQADRGQNRKAMLKWNAFIVEQLGIDNVALFSLYE